MVEEVAEVVAVVRAEKSGFEQGMREADETAKGVAKRSREQDRESVDGANRTAAALGRVRLGWLGVAGAIGLAGNLLSRGPLAQAQAQQRKFALDLIGDQLFRGTGLADLGKATNRRLFELGRRLRDARAADPTGEGNLAIGGVETAREKLLAIGTGPFDQGFVHGSRGGAGTRAVDVLGGGALVGRGLLRGALGGTEGGIRDIEGGRGIIAGALSGVDAAGLSIAQQRLLDRSSGGSVTVRVELAAEQSIRGAFNDPEVQRSLQRALQEEMRKNMTGGYSG